MVSARVRSKEETGRSPEQLQGWNKKEGGIHLFRDEPTGRDQRSEVAALENACGCRAVERVVRWRPCEVWRVTA